MRRVEAAERSDGRIVRQGDGAARERTIALTFDDGPSEQTPAVLDVLARAGARATFFLQGRELAGRESIVRRTAAEGHELGNHLYSHPHAAELTEQEVEREIRETNHAIDRAAGVVPSLIRPPYGEDAERVARVAGRLGFSATVLWSVDPGDWADTSSDEITRRVLTGARPGGIVLLHDGRHDRSRTLDALPQIVDGLQRQGYRLATVSDLLAGEDACS